MQSELFLFLPFIMDANNHNHLMVRIVKSRGPITCLPTQDNYTCIYIVRVRVFHYSIQGFILFPNTCIVYSSHHLSFSSFMSTTTPSTTSLLHTSSDLVIAKTDGLPFDIKHQTVFSALRRTNLTVLVGDHSLSPFSSSTNSLILFLSHPKKKS